MLEQRLEGLRAVLLDDVDRLGKIARPGGVPLLRVGFQQREKLADLGDSLGGAIQSDHAVTDGGPHAEFGFQGTQGLFVTPENLLGGPCAFEVERLGGHARGGVRRGEGAGGGRFLPEPS